MKSVFFPYQVAAVGFVLFVMAASSFASTTTTEGSVIVSQTPPTLAVTDTIPSLEATAYAVFDVETGEILGAHNSQTPLPIASVTKLLTAATVLRTVDADASYTVQPEDLEAHGRSGRLAVGEVYGAYELLFPLLLESSNDAAAILERETHGDIVRRMNAYAKELGATSLAVADTSGLSAQNVASVQDLVALSSRLYEQTPHLFDMTQLSKRAGTYVAWANNSPVLSSDYRGGKHGYTEAAGRTILALFEEELAGGPRVLGYVVLGSDDLASDVATLRSFVKKHVALQ